MDNGERLTRVEERSKSNTKRIDILVSKVDDLQTLTKTVAVLAEQMSHMGNDVKHIKEAVECVENRPFKNISKVIWIIVTAICSAIVSAFITYIIGR